jgi:hypothetical protein
LIEGQAPVKVAKTGVINQPYFFRNCAHKNQQEGITH